jgi:alpha-N-arabinofuranosidase
MFRDAISTAYPELVIVASTVNVTLSEGEIGDYHIYTTPDGFATYFDFFDNNPAGSQTFVGEYATVQPNGIATAPHSSNFSLPLSPAPFWIGSVAEAIFLIGGERNADRVFGAAYAPSFENLDMSDAIAWDVDMVGFTANTTNLVRSTSHRVLDLLSGTRFTTTRPVSTIEEVGPLYWVAGANIPTNQLVFKAAVYNSTGPVPVTVQFEGLSSGASANLTILTGTDPYASNGYDQPEVVITNSTMLKSTDAGFSFELPNLSVAVLSTFPNNSPDSTFATELTKSGYGGYTGCSLGRPVVSSWGNGC